MLNSKGQFMKGHKISHETRIKMLGRIPWNKNKKGVHKHSKETIQKFLGRIPWNKGKTGLFNHTETWKKELSVRLTGIKRSSQTRAKMGSAKKGILKTDQHKMRISIARTGKLLGENHPNWKGGASRGKHTLTNPPYKKWRKSVFERDKFTCKLLNNACKGQLQAHHIQRWADYPELRYELTNGITLCQGHHPRKVSEEKRLAPLFNRLVSVS
jgi:hypothetical protein